MRIGIIGAGSMGGILARHLAKRQQPGTPAYCRDLEAAALQRALSKADRSRIAKYRTEEEARIERHIATQTTKG